MLANLQCTIWKYSLLVSYSVLSPWILLLVYLLTWIFPGMSHTKGAGTTKGNSLKNSNFYVQTNVFNICLNLVDVQVYLLVHKDYCDEYGTCRKMDSQLPASLSLTNCVEGFSEAVGWVCTSARLRISREFSGIEDRFTKGSPNACLDCEAISFLLRSECFPNFLPHPSFATCFQVNLK